MFKSVWFRSVRLTLEPYQVDPDAVAVDREAIVALDDAKQAERMKVARLKERTEILNSLPDTFVTMERQIAAAQAHARYVSRA